MTFTNDGGEMHNASSSDARRLGHRAAWRTANRVAVTFNRPGTYNFNCSPHPSMIGQIVVTGEAVASAPPVVVQRGPAPPGAPQGARA